MDAGPADVWAPAGEAAAPEMGGKRQTPQPRDAPPDFLDFASFLEAPKLAPEASADRPRSEDDWLTRSTRPRRLRWSRRSGASHTDPDAAGDRRPADGRPSPKEPQSDSAAALELLDRIARAAGVPERAFASRNPDELADEIGARFG